MKRLALMLAFTSIVLVALAQAPPSEKVRKDTTLGLYLTDSVLGKSETGYLVRETTLVKQFVQPQGQLDANKVDSVVVKTEWVPSNKPPTYYLLSNPQHKVTHVLADFNQVFLPPDHRAGYRH